MAAGTKVSLAVAALLIVGLVMYYSSLSDDDTITTDTDDPSQVQLPIDRDETQERSTPRQTERVVERPATTDPLASEPEPAAEPEQDEPSLPASSRSSGRLLGDSVDQALGRPPVNVSRPGLSPGSADEAGPIDDREPVDADMPPSSDGGKDAPDDEPPAAADEGDDEDTVDEPASSGDEDEADEPETPQRPERPAYTIYTVKSGDTMSSIARDWFGDDAKWDLIARANPLVDPNRLAIGDELRLPPKDAQRDDDDEPADGDQTTYVVRSGDTLSRIAARYYNDASKWRVIADANRDLLKGDPDNLRVGMRLEIPPAPQPAE